MSFASRVTFELRASVTERQTHVLVGFLEVATGIGIVLYWSLFFLFDVKPTAPPTCYLSFEHSFVLPDLLLSACLCFGGAFAIAGKARALISLPSGGGLIYLGLTDLGFNAMNGIYAQNGFQTLQTLAINGWCMIFGAMLIVIRSREMGANSARSKS
jgi:hypothetical protein